MAKRLARTGRQSPLAGIFGGIERNTLLLKKDDQTKAIPIIAVTASVTPEDETYALKSGCAAYVTKPVNIGNLLSTVESFLSSSSPY